MGSSSSSKSGCINSARASEMRMRQPPEKCLVGESCMSMVKPRPERMRRAWLSLASARIDAISS